MPSQSETEKTKVPKMGSTSKAKKISSMGAKNRTMVMFWRRKWDMLDSLCPEINRDRH